MGIHVTRILVTPPPKRDLLHLIAIFPTAQHEDTRTRTELKLCASFCQKEMLDLLSEARQRPGLSLKPRLKRVFTAGHPNAITHPNRVNTNLEEERIVDNVLDLHSRSFFPRLSGVEDVANRLLEERDI